MILRLLKGAFILWTLAFDAQAGRHLDSFHFDRSKMPQSNCIANVQELMDLLLQSSAPTTPLSQKAKRYSSPEKILSVLIKQTPPTEWKAFAIREYGEELGSKSLSRLQKIDPALEPLIASPGIVNYLDELETFAKRLSTRERKDHSGVYRKFKKHLGSETYFRGMTLTPGEFKEITEHGFVPRFYRIPNYLEDMNASIQNGIGWGVGKHLSGQSFFTLSLTKQPEIALCVANQVERFGANRGLFLFEVEVPKLEVFEYGRKLPYPSHADPVWNQRLKEGISLELKTQKNIPLRYALGPNVESFIVGGINPNQIKKVWLAPKGTDIPTYAPGTWVKKEPNPETVKEMKEEILKQLKAVSLQRPQ